MDYIDYKNWANEYRDQVKILDEKLSRRKGKRNFPTPEERQIFENTTKILYEMRLDCIKTLAVLEEKAQEIKEAEQYAENGVA